MQSQAFIHSFIIFCARVMCKGLWVNSDVSIACAIQRLWRYDCMAL